jgi:hypothetical protein
MDNIKELSSKHAIHIVLVVMIIGTYLYMDNLNKQNKKRYKKKYAQLKQKIIHDTMQREKQKHMIELDSISDDSHMVSVDIPRDQFNDYEPQGIESDVASSHLDTIDPQNGVPRDIEILVKDYPRELSRKHHY